MDVPETAKILIGEVESVDISEEFAHEKLSPVLAMYRGQGLRRTRLERPSTSSPTAATATPPASPLPQPHPGREGQVLSERMKTCRILVNTPSSFGGIGDLYNFKLAPSLTLGCGSWGGNSVSENVGVKHLLNIKTVAERRETCFGSAPVQKVYIKKGCLPVALAELKARCWAKSGPSSSPTPSSITTGYTKNITDRLDEMGIATPPSLTWRPIPPCLRQGGRGRHDLPSSPDCIIAIGGGSAMDAG